MKRKNGSSNFSSALVTFMVFLVGFQMYQTGIRQGKREGVAYALRGKLHNAGDSAFYIELPGGTKQWFEDKDLTTNQWGFLWTLGTRSSN